MDVSEQAVVPANNIMVTSNDNCTQVVTGAGSGIGRATAELFAESGAQVRRVVDSTVLSAACSVSAYPTTHQVLCVDLNPEEAQVPRDISDGSDPNPCCRAGSSLRDK